MAGKVNPDQMTLGASMVGDIYSSMAQELFLRMIERIKQRGTVDLERDPYLWQLQKLNDMAMLNRENLDYVIEQTGIAKQLLGQILVNEGLAVYTGTAEEIAKATGRATPNYNDVKETLEGYANQTFLDIDNFVNQTLITTNFAQNAIVRTYKAIVEQSVAEVVTGLKSADKAISDTVMKWIDKGIPSAFVDKGGHTWTIERYALTVVESTTYRVYNEMRTGAAEQMGVNTFHMSSHAAARPACAPIQGRIVTKAEHGFQSGDKSVGCVESLWAHGYGTPSGTFGINCHHYLTPFIIGVNEMPDDEIPDPNTAIANGEKQAKQRAYERGIRDAKYKVAAAKALGDEGLRHRYQVLLDSRRAGLRKLLDENDFLHRDYAREKIYTKSQLAKVYQSKIIAEQREKALKKLKPVEGLDPIKQLLHSHVDYVDNLKGLEKLEFAAGIKMYSGQDYAGINEALRTGKGFDQYKNTIELIDKQINDVTLDAGIVVKRSFWGHGSSADRVKEIFGGLEVGSTETQLAYSSTTIGDYIDGFGPNQIELTVPAGKGHGFYIDGNSEYPEEEEFLLPRNIKYKITGIEVDKTGNYHIKAEVIFDD